MARGGYRPGAGRPRLSDEEKAARKAAREAGKQVPAMKAPPKKRGVPKKARPGAQQAPQAESPEVPDDIVSEAALADMSPLDYMLQVMRNPRVEGARRDRMAIAAAPFVHARREPVGQGKRDAAKDAAEKAAGGRFGARPAPLKLVGGG